MNDSIVIAPTDHYPEQTEDAVVTAITPADGNAATVRLDLSRALTFNHHGMKHDIRHQGNDKLYTLDARAEVADLTR